MWELDHKEGWVLKNWCFWTVVLKTLESHLDCKKIQSILKEINPEYSLKGLLLKLKLQCFGHLMRRANSLDKTLMLGKIEGERRGWQDEMVGWHYWLNAHDLEQAPRDGEEQESLESYSAWSCKSWTLLSDWTTKMVEWKVHRMRVLWFQL